MLAFFILGGGKMPKSLDACVLKMEGKVDNAFAFCTWADQQGIDYEAEEAAKKYKEACASGSLAAVTRTGAKSMESDKDHYLSKTAAKSWNQTEQLREVGEVDLKARTMPVTLISVGLGNKADKHFYTENAIRNGARLFEGCKSFLNHATAREDIEIPERKVEKLSGFISDVKCTKDGQKLVGIYHFAESKAGDEAMALAVTSLNYQKQYPAAQRPWCGLSIDADGTTRKVLVDGQLVKVVDEFKEVLSVDVVTAPARGGQFNERLLESGLGGGSMELFKKNPDKAKAAEAAYKAVRGKMGEAEGKALDDVMKAHADSYEPAAPEDQDQAKSDKEAEVKKREEEAKKKEEEVKKAMESVAGARKLFGDKIDTLLESARKEGKEEAEKIFASKNFDFSKLRSEKEVLENMVRMNEAEKIASRKIQESGLEEWQIKVKDLVKFTESEMDEFIADRKKFCEKLIESSRGPVRGAGPNGGQGSPVADSKFVEAARKNGLLKK